MLGMLMSGPGLTGIGIAFLLAFGGIQTYRLKLCDAEGKAAKAQITVMGAQIGEQNRAVEALEAAGRQKAKEAAQALAKAEGRARVWDEQAKRLAGLLAAPRAPDAPPQPTDCAAAWRELRK